MFIPHERPQAAENWASRPLCHTQAVDRQISTTVGDHAGIPAVVRFVLFVSCFSRVMMMLLALVIAFHVSCLRCLARITGMELEGQEVLED